MNFSRVEWHTHVDDGKYVKDVDPATDENLPEENWVWSPQGIVNMHYPETWGFVQFVEAAGAVPAVPDDHGARMRLRDVYFTLRNGRAARGSYRGITVPGGPPLAGWAPPVIEATTRSFVASMRHFDGRTLWIREDGRIWMTAPRGEE